MTGAQREFFDDDDGPPPEHLARRDDPPESHDAAEFIQTTLGALQRWALDQVEAYPGCTANEHATRLGLRDCREIGRRLPEIVDKGWARRGESRRCNVTNRPAATWWPRTGPHKGPSVPATAMTGFLRKTGRGNVAPRDGAPAAPQVGA